MKLILILYTFFSPALILALSISDGIQNFETAISRGDSLALDDELLSTPFNQMEEHLSSAPVCLEILSHLSLVSTGRDFPLNDNITWIPQYLQFPGSFRASISQVNNAALDSFIEAHGAMFEIKLNTAQVKGHLGRAIKILFQGTPHQVETLFPLQLEQIRDVADVCSSRAKDVVSKFQVAKKIIFEIVNAGIAKEGRAEDAKKHAELEAMIEKENKIRLEEEAAKIEKMLAEQNKALADAQEKFDQALEDLEPSWWAMAGQLGLLALGPTLKGISTLAKTQKQRIVGGVRRKETEDNCFIFN